MTCNIDIPEFSIISDVTALDVSSKYIQLMKDSLGEDSIYGRTKNTILSLYDNLVLTADERATIATQTMATIVGTLSQSSMQTALAWATEERDGPYKLAQIKAATSIANAEYVKAQAEICSLEMEAKLKCATIGKITADSIRENGHTLSFGEDGCSITALDNSGLKYEQIQQVKASSYQIMADAYRKSGVVTIGIDDDGVYKGLEGDDYGYTNAQIEFSARQKIAFEDSKVSQAVNGTSSMIGQMLTAEIAPNYDDVNRWRNAIDKLLTPHSSTANP